MTLPGIDDPTGVRRIVLAALLFILSKRGQHVASILCFMTHEERFEKEVPTRYQGKDQCQAVWSPSVPF